MSFIYATKCPYDDFGQERENVQIFSETMITPRDTNGFQWGKRTLELVKRYGLIKSMILSPKSCFSFAGNDIRYANIFLDRLYKKRNCSDEELIELAFSVHKEAGPDAIEFIICTADDEDHLTITCIKDGKVYPNCSVAWLGDKNVFERLQQLRLLDEEKNISAAFKLAIEKSQQPEKEEGRFSVGGFIVQVMYRFSEHRFVYPFHFETHVEREQTVKPGEDIRLFAPAEDGGYTATCRDSTKDFIIDLEQPNMTIAYTDRYRYAEPDSINSSTNHLMLPLLIQTDSGNVLL